MFLVKPWPNKTDNKFLFAECKYKIFRKLIISHSVLSHFTYITRKNTLLRTFLRQCHYKPDSYTCSSRRPSCWGPVSSKYGTRESTEYIEHHEHPLDMSIWSLLKQPGLSIRRGNDCRTASRIMYVAHGLWLGLHDSFFMALHTRALHSSPSFKGLRHSQGAQV